MGDAENNVQPSKKRAAGVQLSRENPDLDDNEETSEQEGGTFKRASDEVLAARRIVKVRRQQTSSTPSAPAPPTASNPFAAIKLVAPASAPAAEVETSNDTEQISKNEPTKSENESDEPKVESAEGVKTDVNNDNNKSPDSQINESKPELNSEKNEPDDVGEQTVSKPAEEEKDDNSNEAKKVREVDSSKNETREDVEESKRNDEEKVNDDVTTEKNAETASFSSFQQLSSSQNAFSGLTGTGFSSTSFSFGSSTPKDGSPFGSSSGFGFGGSNSGNSSIFGTSVAGAVGKSDGDKFPAMQEVPIETGEENEKPVFTADSMLFEFSEGKWKERGKGELKVNVPTTGTGKARLIMRSRGNYRLILNAILFPDMKLTNMDKKGITFACVNSAADGKEGLSTIALKFKDPSLVEDFRAAVNEHKAKTSTALKTPENSP